MDREYDSCPYCGGALGKCETCLEVVKPEQRFCSALCERIDEREQNRKRRTQEVIKKWTGWRVRA